MVKIYKQMQNYVEAIAVQVDFYIKTGVEENAWRNAISGISQLLPHLTIGECYLDITSNRGEVNEVF